MGVQRQEAPELSSKISKTSGTGLVESGHAPKSSQNPLQLEDKAATSRAGFRLGMGAETVSVPDTAAYLNMSVETVRRLLGEGQLQGFRLSRAKVRVFKLSVVQYLKEQQALPVYDSGAQAALHVMRQREHARLRKVAHEDAAEIDPDRAASAIAHVRQRSSTATPRPLPAGKSNAPSRPPKLGPTRGRPRGKSARAALQSDKSHRTAGMRTSRQERA